MTSQSNRNGTVASSALNIFRFLVVGFSHGVGHLFGLAAAACRVSRGLQNYPRRSCVSTDALLTTG
jgi:hypothetical protein